MVTEAFRGRVVLVTGGSGGIGAALCRELSAQGAAVAIGYGTSEGPAQELAGELASGGAAAVALGADLEDPGAPARLCAQAERELGAVDILIANHGLAVQRPYEDLDAEAFDRTLAVNLRAPFLLAQAVLPGMRERAYGRILFMSSVAAFRGGVVGADYAASKAGLHGITHFLASRTAADGVTVNALAPGFIDTPMLPGDAEQLAGGVPVGRVGRPEEVADLALAILRNGYLTNQVLSIDGGMHPR